MVITTNNRSEFTRKDCVRALAHMEGGAHVPRKVQLKYAELRRLGIGFTVHEATGDEIDPGNPVLATVRQITFEVETTLEEQLGHLLR